LVGLFALFSCFEGNNPEQKPTNPTETQEETPPPLVRVISPERRALEESLPVTGRLVALVKEDLTARLAGVRILKFLADVGDRLPKGAEVAVLERDDIEHSQLEASASVREAQAQLKETSWARKELLEQQKVQARTIERKKQVFERLQREGRGVAQDDVDAAQYEYDRELSTAETMIIQIEKANVVEAQAQVALDKANLALKKADREVEWTSVKTLSGGIVMERMGSLGQVTSHTTPLFRVYDPDSTILSCRVPQGRLRDVRVGQSGEFSNDAYPGLIFIAAIELIEPSVDQETGVVNLRLRVDSKRTQADPRNAKFLSGDVGLSLKQNLADGRVLRPGMYFSGRLILSREEASLVIPRKAVDFHLGQSSLFLIESTATNGDKEHFPVVLRIPFREGLGEEGYVQVLPLGSGRSLKDGDRVVLVGQDRLKNGDRVRVAPDDAEVEGQAPAGEADK
jgi:multidrug efflux pump subunit AcrA (membrane-fusion protein)